MDSIEIGKIVNELLETEEVTFTYNNHFIHIQESTEGGYDGSVFNNEMEYDNAEDPIDGGVCDSDVLIDVIEFFTDISRDLK